MPSPTAETIVACPPHPDTGPEISPDTPPDITEDRLLDGRVRLLQPRQGYRAAIDPVLLAASIDARPGQALLELGCGTGAALLCLAVRRPDVTLRGIELQPAAAALAARSAALSGVAARVSVAVGDIQDPAVPAAAYDQIFSNPPFHEAGAHSPSPDPGKARSHGESTGLDPWIRAAARALKPRGALTLIFPAGRVDQLIAALQPRFGGLVLFPLWPRDAVPAKRVIVRAVLDSRAPARIAPGLVLHHVDGAYTAAAEAVLRHAGALPLA